MQIMWQFSGHEKRDKIINVKNIKYIKSTVEFRLLLPGQQINIIKV